MALEGLLREGGTLGGAALGGVLGSIFDLPRQMLWQGVWGTGVPRALGLGEEAPETGAQLMGRLGMDEGSPLARALGVGAELVLDPFTLMGGVGGRAVGRTIGREADFISDVARLGRESAAASRVEALREAERAAEEALARSGRSQLGPIPSHVNVTYSPEVMAQVPPLFKPTHPSTIRQMEEALGAPLGWQPMTASRELREFLHKGPRTYRRFDPEVAAQLDQLGLAHVTPEGLLQMDVPGRTTLMKGRGGKMLPTGEAVRGTPLVDITTGEPVYAEWPGLFGPREEYARSLAGVPGLAGPAAPPNYPTLAEVLGPERARALYEALPDALFRDLPPRDLGTRKLQRHLVDQPLPLALENTRNLLVQALQDLERAREASQIPLTPLEKGLLAISSGMSSYAGGATGFRGH